MSDNNSEYEVLYSKDDNYFDCDSVEEAAVELWEAQGGFEVGDTASVYGQKFKKVMPSYFASDLLDNMVENIYVECGEENAQRNDIFDHRTLIDSITKLIDEEFPEPVFLPVGPTTEHAVKFVDDLGDCEPVT